jgi:2-amino-4-hydroxy-6-hydroxymethyldihydropteridine diphosphokinase
VADTQPVIAYVALGANLGDRRANIRSAVSALDATPGVRVMRVSRLIENPAVGGPADSPPFLNGVAEVNTTLAPHALLARLLEIERSLGRERREKWEPRPIDLDLILYGDQVIDTPDLQVPHPLMQERRFVLEPLAGLAPGVVHPVSGLTVREMLADLDEGESFPPRTGVIDRSVRCAGCGYDLRGLPARHACPECGRPTTDSLNPERFEPAKPVEADANPFREDLRQIRSHFAGVARECGCAQQAVLLVVDAVAMASPSGGGAHVHANELVSALKDLAMDLFNGDEAVATATLESWGITRSEDVGRIVTALIGARRLKPSEGDRAADFNGLFVTESLFKPAAPGAAQSPE